MLGNKEGLRVLTLERISSECPGTNLSPHLQDFLGHFLHSSPEPLAATYPVTPRTAQEPEPAS